MFIRSIADDQSHKFDKTFPIGPLIRVSRSRERRDVCMFLLSLVPVCYLPLQAAGITELNESHQSNIMHVTFSCQHKNSAANWNFITVIACQYVLVKNYTCPPAFINARRLHCKVRCKYCVTEKRHKYCMRDSGMFTLMTSQLRFSVGMVKSGTTMKLENTLYNENYTHVYYHLP
jgi:hypothetical protein